MCKLKAFSNFQLKNLKCGIAKLNDPVLIQIGIV
jgi:hypothetical protein